ncbi:hypothetical protein GMD78_06075 [Ornithinibacillus sp. L9]|uniref:Uncharacterized protein n=1 Tax=Ornithinibacillus caprae TaxID=2678566 RepID=A0A6N8FI80_9BACI|nr:hypothetical protein [Ornithinibacillus caprae]MUK87964.1 hypothetical protein [Ornithinibacillus caprae]
MIGLLVAITVFNIVAFKTNKKLSHKQIAHIWAFTIAFQMGFDQYLDNKYQGYWYFTKDIDWESLPALILLIPPVNMLFLNWFPFSESLRVQLRYILLWEIPLLMYELIALLPEPWGYFNYGWWNIWYSALLNPVLLSFLAMYYRKFIA